MTVDSWPRVGDDERSHLDGESLPSVYLADFLLLNVESDTLSLLLNFGLWFLKHSL